MLQKYAALLSLLLIGLCVLAYAVLTTQHNENVVLPTQYAVRIIPNVVYGPMPDEVLDECLPVGAAVARPGLILIHGGGWFEGDKAQFAQECSSYAARGFVTVSTNYRLTTGGYRWPDQIGDAQLAVRFLRAHAVLLNLDPARICSFGGSAGSQLALLLDMSKSKASDVAYLYPNISPAVNCAVDQFGPSDLVRLYAEPHTGRIDLQPLLNEQTPTSDPVIYADASPVDQVTTQTGPVLITQGTEDTVVLPDQSIELWAALQKAHISGCYISYNGGHRCGLMLFSSRLPTGLFQLKAHKGYYMTVLANDTFQRADNASSWGSASDTGGAWTHASGTATISISSNQGKITEGTASQVP